MENLERIETKYNFEYPRLYKQLYSDKMLEFGKAGPKWFSETFPKLKTNPPLLLFANEYEFIEFDDDYLFNERFKNPGIFHNPDLRLIPLAGNGAGDYYCFYLNGEQDNDIPIVFVWHDTDQIDYQSKNLQDFIFLKMLETVYEFDEDSIVMDGDFTANILSMLKTHKKYLTARQAQIIEQIYQRAFNENGLLSDLEFTQIIIDNINFDKLNQHFKYIE
ncbi:MAG: SMI1/KNR4 family protein [Flavobacterium sp.]|nr:MAG: SMI1/KNR4 family protein [Flavobacterium sp.]